MDERKSMTRASLEPATYGLKGRILITSLALWGTGKSCESPGIGAGR
jgi:hypothetical protein